MLVMAWRRVAEVKASIALAGGIVKAEQNRGEDLGHAICLLMNPHGLDPHPYDSLYAASGATRVCRHSTMPAITLAATV